MEFTEAAKLFHGLSTSCFWGQKVPRQPAFDFQINVSGTFGSLPSPLGTLVGSSADLWLAGWLVGRGLEP